MICSSYYTRHLLTWGAGRFGQLGNNDREDSVLLQNITPCIPPQAGRVVQVDYNIIV